MYDWAHGIEDSMENISHSICTLEFEDHRPLYDWFLDELDIFRSHQYEFARLNITHTVLSKRRLLELVENNHVEGWDDPAIHAFFNTQTPDHANDFAIRQDVQFFTCFGLCVRLRILFGTDGIGDVG